MLVLLLVLVPLIPAALMIRFMLDTLRVEQLAAWDRLQQLHSERLAVALGNPATAPDGDPEAQARVLLEALNRVGAEGTTARVLDASGRLLAGEPSPWGQLLTEGSPESLPGATVQLHLVGPEVLNEAIADQRRILVWTATIAIVAVVLIAGFTGLALNRQIAISELKNTSVATVAHELRTPLASMRMLVDTLREGRYREAGQLREYLDLIAAENVRLSRLAETFLTYSRLNAGASALQHVEIEPHVVVDQAVTPLRSRLEAPGCHFSQSVPQNLPAVFADRDALAQVLTNLLDNALKYTEAKKEIGLRAFQDNGNVVFEVKDNGVGISPEEQRDIFKEFYQVDRTLARKQEGCGLGLAIVKRIVDAHEGKIDVASEPGKGSVFTIKIPAV